MTDPATTKPAPPPRRVAWWAWLLLALSVATLLVVAELSPRALTWMRVHWAFFNWPMIRIELLEMRTGMNIQHILMFAWIGFLLRCIWRRARWWWPWLVLTGLAVITELAQFMSPGRTPRWTDIRDDLLGAVVGWFLGWLVLRAARSIDASRSRRPVDRAKGETTAKSPDGTP